MTPEERTAKSLGGRIGANRRWAAEPDRAAAMKPALQGFLDRFERQADPDGILDPVERGQRAERLRKAYFAELSLKAAQARRRRRPAPQPRGDAA